MDGNHVSVALKVVGCGVAWVVYFGGEEMVGLWDCRDCWGCGFGVWGLGLCGLGWGGMRRKRHQTRSKIINRLSAEH